MDWEAQRVDGPETKASEVVMNGERSSHGRRFAVLRFMVPGMAESTAKQIKLEARRRAREEQGKANAERVKRDRANVEDVAIWTVAVNKVATVDAWETERLAAVRDQVRAEAARRRAADRAQGSAAIARMQGRGETLATIAKLAGVSVGVTRTWSRYSPTTPTPTTKGGSDALGADTEGQ